MLMQGIGALLVCGGKGVRGVQGVHAWLHGIHSVKVSRGCRCVTAELWRRWPWLGALRVMCSRVRVHCGRGRRRSGSEPCARCAPCLSNRAELLGQTSSKIDREIVNCSMYWIVIAHLCSASYEQGQAAVKAAVSIAAVLYKLNLYSIEVCV